MTMYHNITKGDSKKMGNNTDYKVCTTIINWMALDYADEMALFNKVSFGIFQTNSINNTKAF